jgi:hypothetical protein
MVIDLADGGFIMIGGCAPFRNDVGRNVKCYGRRLDAPRRATLQTYRN